VVNYFERLYVGVYWLEEEWEEEEEEDWEEEDWEEEEEW
jgi:hypothetical protein